MLAQVLNTKYLEKYYKTAGAREYSMQDLQLESMADPETVPFESRSIDMRVLTGQTSVFYTVSHQHREPSVSRSRQPCQGNPTHVQLVVSSQAAIHMLITCS